jgi:hypothetical protein
MALIRQVCYVCKKIYGYKEAYQGINLDTHGLCPECYPKELERLEKEIARLNREEKND